MTWIAIAPDGQVLVVGLTLLALVLFAVAGWLGRWTIWFAGYVIAILVLASAFFFRDPPRDGERGPGIFVSPADGRVTAVERVEEPSYLHGPATRVSIYLNLLDVHVQRSPVDGVVDWVERRPGRFAAAWSDRAATENEQTSIGINAGEVRVMVRQIAGVIVRRIVTYAEEGELLDQGERIGLIRFGSRVDAFLPPSVVVEVRPGDRVRAGATVLARAAPEAP